MGASKLPTSPLLPSASGKGRPHKKQQKQVSYGTVTIIPARHTHASVFLGHDDNHESPSTTRLLFQESLSHFDTPLLSPSVHFDDDPFFDIEDMPLHHSHHSKSLDPDLRKRPLKPLLVSLSIVFILVVIALWGVVRFAVLDWEERAGVRGCGERAYDGRGYSGVKGEGIGGEMRVGFFAVGCLVEVFLLVVWGVSRFILGEEGEE